MFGDRLKIQELLPHWAAHMGEAMGAAPLGEAQRIPRLRMAQGIPLHQGIPRLRMAQRIPRLRTAQRIPLDQRIPRLRVAQLALPPVGDAMGRHYNHILKQPSLPYKAYGHIDECETIVLSCAMRRLTGVLLQIQSTPHGFWLRDPNQVPT